MHESVKELRSSAGKLKPEIVLRRYLNYSLLYFNCFLNDTICGITESWLRSSYCIAVCRVLDAMYINL